MAKDTNGQSDFGAEPLGGDIAGSGNGVAVYEFIFDQSGNITELRPLKNIPGIADASVEPPEGGESFD